MDIYESIYPYKHLKKKKNPSALREGQETVLGLGFYTNTTGGRLPLGRSRKLAHKSSHRYKAVWLPRGRGLGLGGMGRNTEKAPAPRATESPLSAPYHEPSTSSVPLGEGQECGEYVERHLLPVGSLGKCQLVLQ